MSRISELLYEYERAHERKTSLMEDVAEINVELETFRNKIIKALKDHGPMRSGDKVFHLEPGGDQAKMTIPRAKSARYLCRMFNSQAKRDS